MLASKAICSLSLAVISQKYKCTFYQTFRSAVGTCAWFEQTCLHHRVMRSWDDAVRSESDASCVHQRSEIYMQPRDVDSHSMSDKYTRYDKRTRRLSPKKRAVLRQFRKIKFTRNIFSFFRGGGGVLKIKKQEKCSKWPENDPG